MVEGLRMTVAPPHCIAFIAYESILIVNTMFAQTYLPDIFTIKATAMLCYMLWVYDCCLNYELDYYIASLPLFYFCFSAPLPACAAFL